MAEGLVDLRSDTVTQPTPEMRRAMAEAEVGDDVYGEDPTVNALQEAFAERVGKPAALFVPSGTMGNQLALRLLARPGSAVVAGRRQHIAIFENGAGGYNAGVQFHLVDDSSGTLSVDDIRWAVAAAEHHWPNPSLVCLENTHMPAGGIPWPIAALTEVYAVAASAGLEVHVDGARMFNAAVATGVAARDYAAGATTVMCCLSKGLCAPVGSLLAGPVDLIDAARGERQRFGGGMRQAGILAAAGLVALSAMIDRLVDDHRRARRLADVVAERWPQAMADPASVTTNIVTFTHSHPPALLDHLRTEGVLAGTIAPGVMRLVTHADVDDEAIERAVGALSKAPT
jgi:threonine aldolase